MEIKKDTDKDHNNNETYLVGCTQAPVHKPQDKHTKTNI
jgi:hypothetical protein